jgi:hypothetical protein
VVRIFRERNRPIVHLIRLYRPDGSSLDLCRRQDVERSKRVELPWTQGMELVDELKPSPDVRLDAERPLDGSLRQIGVVEWTITSPAGELSTGLP